MEEKQSYAEQNKARLKEITDSIETGIQELFESDKYRQYLSTMSRFHRYSVNNTMLIYMQRPDATHVASFNKWRDQFGRNVIKGEKGIRIIAPTPFKKTIEYEKLDPDTHLPVKDADGNSVMVEKTIQVPMYKPVVVFDVKQTDGKPLPQLAANLTGNVHNFEVFMEALKRSAPVPIVFEKMAEDMDGYFSLDDQRISVREGMSEVQTVCAAVHEIAHSMLHNKDEIGEEYQDIELFGKPALFSNGRIDRDKLPEGLYCYDLRGSDDDPGIPVTIQERVVVNHAASVITAEPLDLTERSFLYLGDDGLNFTGSEQTMKEFFHAQYPEKAKLSRATEEIQAESISFAVCAYYGIETGENSFGYLATWAKDKNLTELRSSLETINKASSALITDIDRNYAEIMKEHEAELIASEPAGTDEHLFTVNDKYLHIQRTDTGVDYTLYDKTSLTEIDGGQLDMETTTLTEAAIEVCKLHEIGQNSPLQLTDIGILEKIQAVQDAAISIEPPVEETPELPTDVPPDPAISAEVRNAFGYTDDAMLPLTKERAMELFERDVPVYLLYGDNTEAMVFEQAEILNHDGIFSIDRTDWEAVKEKFPVVTENKWQKEFLDNPADSYCIYQLKRSDETAELLFMSRNYLREHNLELSYENYDAVYSGQLSANDSLTKTLDDLYMKFNVDCPQDFTGHSMSVSDIVALKQNDVVSCHYVDSIGFANVPSFIPENYLKNAEMAMEDDYGMIDGIVNNGPQRSSAEIESEAESGKPISLLSYVEAVRREQQERKEEPLPEKKPSVLAKLQAQVSEPKKPARLKSAEREL